MNAACSLCGATFARGRGRPARAPRCPPCRGDPRAPRELLVERHIAFAYGLARRLVAGVPPQYRDDLVAEGVAGMVQASASYRAGGAPFSAYAARRIRGAILDAQRRSDPLSRNERARLRAAGEDGPPPPSSVDELIGAGLDRLMTGFERPGHGLTRNPLWRDVVANFGRLSGLERRVLVLSFERGLTLMEVGREVGLSESGVCRARSRAIARLRDLIEPTLAAAR